MYVCIHVCMHACMDAWTDTHTKRKTKVITVTFSGEQGINMGGNGRNMGTCYCGEGVACTRESKSKSRCKWLNLTEPLTGLKCII